MLKFSPKKKISLIKDEMIKLFNKEVIIRGQLHTKHRKYKWQIKPSQSLTSHSLNKPQHKVKSVLQENYNAVRGYSQCTIPKHAVCAESLGSVWLFATPWTIACQAPPSMGWDCPGKNTRVGCHFLLQGSFPTQGFNLHLLHCRQILYHGATMEEV